MNKIETLSYIIVETVKQLYNRYSILGENLAELDFNSKILESVSHLQSTLERLKAAQVGFITTMGANRLLVLGEGIQAFGTFISDIDHKIKGKTAEMLNLNEFYYQVSEQIEPQLVLTHVSRVPLIVSVLSASFCLICSSAYHSFHITNERLYDLLYKLDYASVCIMMWGGTFPALFYTYSC